MSRARSSHQSINSSSLHQVGVASSSPSSLSPSSLPPSSLPLSLSSSLPSSSLAIIKYRTKQVVPGSTLHFKYCNPIPLIEQSPASTQAYSLPPSQDLSARELKAVASARGNVRDHHLN